MSMIGNLRLVSAGELAALLADPAGIRMIDEEPNDAADHLYLEKSWHVLHWLLTGSAWEGDFPLHFLVAGGTPIGDIDIGYGPARGFSVAEVEQIDAALAPITPDLLRRRFDAKALDAADIYPSGWSDGDPEAVEYPLGYFAELVPFIRRGAAQGRALLVWLD
jgi:hypothetical protein